MTEGENMLERCARALYELEPRRKAWADLGQHRAYHVKRARAVIEALTEPTPEMLRAGVLSARQADEYEMSCSPEFVADQFKAILFEALRTASIPNEEGEGK